MKRLPLGALAEREFRLLWLGRTLSSIGDALLPVAIAFAVLDIGTASDLGIVLGSAMAGRMLFALVGGVWADRLPRRSILIACDLVRAVAQALVALVFFADVVEVWHLAAAFAAVGVADSFGVLFSRSVRELRPRDDAAPEVAPAAGEAPLLAPSAPPP